MLCTLFFMYCVSGRSRRNPSMAGFIAMLGHEQLSKTTRLLTGHSHLLQMFQTTPSGGD
jgi:hypothetical protein